MSFGYYLPLWFFLLDSNRRRADTRGNRQIVRNYSRDMHLRSYPENTTGAGTAGKEESASRTARGNIPKTKTEKKKSY